VIIGISINIQMTVVQPVHLSAGVLLRYLDCESESMPVTRWQLTHHCSPHVMSWSLSDYTTSLTMPPTVRSHRPDNMFNRYGPSFCMTAGSRNYKVGTCESCFFRSNRISNRIGCPIRFRIESSNRISRMPRKP